MSDLCIWIYFMFLIPGALATMLIIATWQVVQCVRGKR